MILFFLPAIIALGIVTSYEDIREGKIRNKWVIIALAYALIVYISIIIYNINAGIDWNYLIAFAINLVVSIGVGFGLWHYNLWSAGDGKLFIAFASLVPLTGYSLGYQRWFPAVTILSHTFLAGLVFLLAFMALKMRRLDLKRSMKKTATALLRPRSIINSALAIFSLYWLIGSLLAYLGMDSYVLRFAAMIFAYTQIIKIGKMQNYIMIGIAILRLIFDKSIYSTAFLYSFLASIIVWQMIFGFLSGTLDNLLEKMFRKTVKTEDLKPKMILDEMITDIKEVPKKRAGEIRRYKGVYYIKRPYTKEEKEKMGMEELDYRLIRLTREIGFKSVRIKQTIPFAPFITIGVLLTLIAKGNILIYLQSLF